MTNTISIREASDSTQPQVEITIQNMDLEINDATIETNGKKYSKCVIITFLGLFLFINLPFFILDFYVAFTDTSCIQQKVPSMDFTFKTWLIVSNCIQIGVFVLVTILSVLLFNKESAFEMCIYIISKILNVFHIAWVITGSVLFWGYMDTGSCDSLPYNYIYARLIMSILAAITLSCKKNEEES